MAELAERHADELEVRVAELRVLRGTCVRRTGSPRHEISVWRQSRCGPGAAHTLPRTAGVPQVRADLQPVTQARGVLQINPQMATYPDPDDQEP